MNALSVMSALGLATLASGVALVNVATSPRVAQCGAITAGAGVLLLVLVGAGQLIR